MTIDTQAEDYVQTQHTIALIASLVKDLPLEEHVATQRHALAVGPILDPTLWRQRHRALEFDLRLSETLLAFQRTVTEIMEAGHAPKTD